MEHHRHRHTLLVHLLGRTGRLDRLAVDRATLRWAVGMSTREIAATVGLSQTSVRHWLRRYGLRTGDRRKTAKEAGLLTAVLRCHRHGETEFILEGRGYYRCKRCRMEAVVKRRRRVKAILVDESGGCCAICGYDRYVGALEFHHVDPQAKRLQISWNGVTQSLETLRAEARKCVLLCSNCHGEVEAGVTELPPGSRIGSSAVQCTPDYAPLNTLRSASIDTVSTAADL